MAKANEIKPGEAKEFLDGQGRKALLVNQNGKIKAFSKICTHLGCEVEWKPEENIFFCPCHLGKFDANGKNIAGPPPRPLDQFKVEVKDNYVFVTLIV
jgi:Rieske Fe-S protein